MKKNLVALLVAALMLLSVVPAMAEISPILPYEGEAIEYHCVGADLITEKPETQVSELRLPQRVSEGESLRAQAVVRSSVATSGKISFKTAV